MKFYTDLSSDELWGAVLEGDDLAAAELINRLDKVILAESRINGVINEDVAQEVREKLLRAIQKHVTHKIS